MLRDDLIFINVRPAGDPDWFDRHMKASVVVFCLTALAPLSSAGPLFTGTWAHGDPETGGGRLLTKHEGARVRFQLECWRGAPSYNSGFVEGEFAVADGGGTFVAPRAVGDCRLHFAFIDEVVVVQYVGESRGCGFGHAVHANGSYRRVSSEEPVFSDGDPRQGPPPVKRRAVERADAPVGALN